MLQRVKAARTVTLTLGPRMQYEDPIIVGKEMRFRVDSKHRLYMIFKGLVVEIKLEGDNTIVVLDDVVSAQVNLLERREERSYVEEDILFSSEEFK